MLSLTFSLVFAGSGLAGLGCTSVPPGTIGAQLGQASDGHLYVRGVPPGQGADKAGLEENDEIVAIDGKLVRDMTPEDVRHAVRGDLGTTLQLRIVRAGEKKDVKVERSPLR